MINDFNKAAFLDLVDPDAAGLSQNSARETFERICAVREMPERMDRIQQVWRDAVATWGDPESAIDFLFRPHAMLGGVRPLDAILDGQGGVDKVQDVLGRLRYGSAA